MFRNRSFLFVLMLAASWMLQSGCSNYYYIVRHAEKAATPPNDPDLSDAGRRRAIVLCDTLRNKNISMIFVSQKVRTQQTAQPSAGFLGIATTQYDRDAPIENLIAQIEQDGAKNMLIVGHSDNVPLLIQRLTGETVTIPEDDYDNLFVIKRTRQNNQTTYTLIRRDTYGAPSP